LLRENPFVFGLRVKKDKKGNTEYAKRFALCLDRQYVKMLKSLRFHVLEDIDSFNAVLGSKGGTQREMFLSEEQKLF